MTASQPDVLAGAYGQCQPFRIEALRPCTLVILGASGDLTRRKLLPALYNLFELGALPSGCQILGCGRTDLTSDHFRQQMLVAIRQQRTLTMEEWERFARLLAYRRLDYAQQADWQDLATWLRQPGLPASRLFYCALPPDQYATVACQLGAVGLQQAPAPDYSRLIIEKPFGHDLASAIALDASLHQIFAEDQLFRIDHYLAKETVQNLLMLRFANALFEPLWNRSYIDSVTIIASEQLGVGQRAGYYDRAGVLRDMFQNHLMQMLALVAMEPPSRFETETVQNEKAKLFRSLRPFSAGDPAPQLLLGQYQAGQIDGQAVVGYRAEAGVAADSCTATYALLQLYIDNWRWSGVPFYLLSGKRLAAKQTAIHIQFKQIPHSLFGHLLSAPIPPNRLELAIYPQERIALHLQTKSPGGKACLAPVQLCYDYPQAHLQARLDAYEKVLLDCLQGDHMMFWRQDGVALSWAYLEPVLGRCGSQPLLPYVAGSWGPPEAADLMARLLNI
jgi:glucose-6-phosphate 1-dehydrogenase